jgi:hypothetical protein
MVFEPLFYQGSGEVGETVGIHRPIVQPTLILVNVG